VAPASALAGGQERALSDEKSLLFALADCLRQEYQAIVDAGLYVQIDDAFLPYMHEKMVPPMPEAQYGHGRSCASTRSITRSRASARALALSHLLGQLERPHAFDVRSRASSICCCR